MLRFDVLETPDFTREEDEFTLSGTALVDLAQAVLEKGKSFRFRARGMSMRPFIKDGDVITISPLSGSKPRLGDIAVFIRPQTGKIVIHRVVRKSGGSFLIKGDNVSQTDGFISLENILGRVTRIERNGRRLNIGMGPERLIIAFLTRSNLLYPLLFPLWKVIRPFVRK